MRRRRRSTTCCGAGCRPSWRGGSKRRTSCSRSSATWACRRGAPVKQSLARPSSHSRGGRGGRAQAGPDPLTHREGEEGGPRLAPTPSLTGRERREGPGWPRPPRAQTRVRGSLTRARLPAAAAGQRRAQGLAGGRRELRRRAVPPGWRCAARGTGRRGGCVARGAAGGGQARARVRARRLDPRGADRDGCALFGGGPSTAPAEAVPPCAAGVYVDDDRRTWSGDNAGGYAREGASSRRRTVERGASG